MRGKIEISQRQVLLVNGLLLFGVDKDAMACIVAGLDTPEMVEQMLDFMCNNEGASTSELLKEMTDIRRRFRENDR